MTHSISNIERFFRNHEPNSNANNIPALVAQYADVFMAAGPQGTQVVRSADFARALSQRKKLFNSLGCQAAALVSLEETPLDTRYTLAKTQWRMNFVRAEVDPLEILVNSAFIIDSGAESPRIVFYLANQDIMAILKDRGILLR